MKSVSILSINKIEIKKKVNPLLDLRCQCITFSRKLRPSVFVEGQQLSDAKIKSH